MHDPKDRLGLGAALNAVAEEARWEALDLISRRGRAAAQDLLRGHAAELSGSPLARVQLLSLALDAAADSLGAGDQTPEISMGDFLRTEALPAEVSEPIRAQAVSASVIGRARSAVDRVGREHAGRAVILEQDALLNERLWSDARLPAADDTRALMLASAPFLRARASAGIAGRSTSIRNLKTLWRRTLARRG